MSERGKLDGRFSVSRAKQERVYIYQSKGIGRERRRFEKDNEGYASTAISFCFQRGRESQKFQFQPDAARTENLFFFFRWFCGLLSQLRGFETSRRRWRYNIYIIYSFILSRRRARKCRLARKVIRQKGEWDRRRRNGRPPVSRLSHVLEKYILRPILVKNTLSLFFLSFDQLLILTLRRNVINLYFFP